MDKLNKLKRKILNLFQEEELIEIKPGESLKANHSFVLCKQTDDGTWLGCYVEKKIEKQKRTLKNDTHLNEEHILSDKNVSDEGACMSVGLNVALHELDASLELSECYKANLEVLSEQISLAIDNENIIISNIDKDDYDYSD